jgi:hypothetical protein
MGFMAEMGLGYNTQNLKPDKEKIKWQHSFTRQWLGNHWHKYVNKYGTLPSKRHEACLSKWAECEAVE